jgi:hypothetical protein
VCVCVRRWEAVSFVQHEAHRHACMRTHAPRTHPRTGTRARARPRRHGLRKMCRRLADSVLFDCIVTLVIFVKVPPPTPTPTSARLARAGWRCRVGSRAHIRAVCGVCRRCRCRRVASLCLCRSSRCRSPTSCAKVRKPGSSRACAAPDGVAVFAAQRARAAAQRSEEECARAARLAAQTGSERAPTRPHRQRRAHPFAHALAASDAPARAHRGTEAHAV